MSINACSVTKGVMEGTLTTPTMPDYFFLPLLSLNLNSFQCFLEADICLFMLQIVPMPQCISFKGNSGRLTSLQYYILLPTSVLTFSSHYFQHSEMWQCAKAECSTIFNCHKKRTFIPSSAPAAIRFDRLSPRSSCFHGSRVHKPFIASSGWVQWLPIQPTLSPFSAGITLRPNGPRAAMNTVSLNSGFSGLD